MFSDQQHIEGKVSLRSFKDALDCLRDAAQIEENQKFQSFVAQRIIDAKNNQNIVIENNQLHAGRSLGESREVKLFQFSNFIFQKFLVGFESYRGDYHGFQQILINGVNSLQTEIKAQEK